ncbi:MAG: PEP-CTERM sorting domain-containing protein [Planctomycetota bacterium]
MRQFGFMPAMAVAACLPVASAHAAVIDSMDNTNFFGPAFGAASVVDNADGTVTLTKTNGANQDSGIEWNNLGAKIDLATSQVTIVPDVLGEDFINVSAIYFDASDNFVNQALVVTDTNQDTPIVFDVAADAGFGAESFVLQIRILPFGAESASYTFDSISVVPEPASVALIAAGAGLLGLRRRPC